MLLFEEKFKKFLNEEVDANLNAEEIYKQNQGKFLGFPYETFEEEAADLGLDEVANTFIIIADISDEDAYDSKFSSMEEDFDNPMSSGGSLFNIGDNHVGRVAFFGEPITIEDLKSSLGDVMVDAYEVK